MENENGNKADVIPEVEKAVNANTPLPKPVCPYCKMDPLVILARTFNIGRFKFLIAFCTSCRNTIPAMLLDVAQPLIERAPGPMIQP